MARIITTYIVVLLLVSLGFFGVGAIASAKELRDPMQSQTDNFYRGSQDFSYR